ncbi:MAG: DNA translocase FtsK 4TM domain-containing protein [Neisseria sp.]|nr:DNA translocase FtsK 4TM domain-containing protein [Neisseria sp.]
MLKQSKKPSVAPKNSRKLKKQVAPVQQFSSPRPEHLVNLINDSIWILSLIVLVYFSVMLFTFDMNDPAWSRSVVETGKINNLGGWLGAHLSDVVYYLFGFSAWWLVIAALLYLIKTFRLFNTNNQKYSAWIGFAGLALVLISSPVFEYALFRKDFANSLPIGAGGLIGSALGGTLSHFLGSTGSFLLALLLVLLSISLIAQVSWLDIMEKLGDQMAWLWDKAVGLLPKHDENASDKVVIADSKTTRRMVQEAQNISQTPDIKPEVTVSNRKSNLQINTPAPAPKQLNMLDADGNIAPIEPRFTGEYEFPSLDLLALPQGEVIPPDHAKLQQTAERIEAKLAEFGISVEVKGATSGPVLTRFEIEPAQGVRGSQISSLTKDLARSLTVQSVRVVETIAGKNTMGIELPNERRQEVTLRELLSAPVFQNAKSKLSVVLGKDIAGVPMIGDLAKMPHLLVAGTTGSGKSVGVNGMIMSILFRATPEEVRFIMIDPKVLELSIYDGIPHLLCPVVTDMSEAGQALNWCVAEMEKRYKLLAHAQVRTLDSYNEKIKAAKDAGSPLFNPFSLNPDNPEPLETLPEIVVIIDEFADLIMTDRKSVETSVARLAQKARAAGIHMVIATQRPSVDVITGLIKANIPTRMAFTVQDKIDSRTILGQGGAEDLLKYGDLLFLQPGNAEPTRMQGAFVSDHEVQAVVEHVKRQAPTDYVEGLLTGEAALETGNIVNPNANSDELFDQAVAFVLETQKVSISSLQRHLRIGYNRSATLVEAMEQAGVVSAADVSGKRTVLARRSNL